MEDKVYNWKDSLKLMKAGSKMRYPEMSSSCYLFWNGRAVKFRNSDGRNIKITKEILDIYRNFLWHSYDEYSKYDLTISGLKFSLVRKDVGKYYEHKFEDNTHISLHIYQDDSYQFTYARCDMLRDFKKRNDDIQNGFKTVAKFLQKFYTSEINQLRNKRIEFQHQKRIITNILKQKEI